MLLHAAGKRLRALQGLLETLRVQCAELGEDAAVLAAEAHPSLPALERVAGLTCWHAVADMG